MGSFGDILQELEDEGCEIIAELLARAKRSTIGKKIW